MSYYCECEPPGEFYEKRGWREIRVMCGTCDGEICTLGRPTRREMKMIKAKVLARKLDQ